MTAWEYARLEYRSTGSFGTDKFMDWQAVFYYPGGAKNWGTDERFDDIKHLNRAGADRTAWNDLNGTERQPHLFWIRHRRQWGYADR